VGRLTPLQQALLRALADFTPAWTLSGGGALVGFHADHRTTRDVDLFWRDRAELGPIGSQVAARLRSAGLRAETIQTGPSHQRYRVSDAESSVVLDLVAEPVPSIERPQVARLGDDSILVDTPHEILVNKLCALLGRSEIRDLEDVEALVASGEDLVRAVSDAPRKDAGFSPLTLAWVLRDFPVQRLAAASGAPAVRALALERAKDDLVARLLRIASPPA